MSNQKDSGGQNSDPCIGTKNCIKQLLLLYERIELRHFTQKYKECFKTEFVCPKGKKHALATCLKEHFKADLELCLINGTVTVCRKQDEIVPYNPSLNEFPTLSEAMKIQPNAKHKNSSSKNSTKPQMPSSLSGADSGLLPQGHTKQDVSKKFKNQIADSKVDLRAQFKGRPGPHVPRNNAEGIVSQAVQAPVTAKSAVQEYTTNAMTFEPQPIQYNQFTPLPGGSPAFPLEHQPGDSVEVSANCRAATYSFDLEGSQSKFYPTEADINERVNHYRKKLSEEGHYVDIQSLSKRLCEYYRVRHVRELGCRDKKISQETDITAIKEFSMTANKVLCIIQAFSTMSTVATLYELEKFICEVEKKTSFAELRLGPLQKFPLVWYHFKFPYHLKIKNITCADIMQDLWAYGGKEGKGKRIDLERFLEHVATKRNLTNPYEMGVRIKSIALAISMVRKTKFNDFRVVKEAQAKMVENMQKELDDYLLKLQRGLTGKNHRALQGEPENVVQKIAGMNIEDGIMEIFNFVHNVRTRLETKVSAPGFINGSDRIMETMKFFRSQPVLTKFFHVLLATCTFRKIGFDDIKLLEFLGFKESIRRMTDEQMVDRFGNDNLRVPFDSKHGTRKRLNKGKQLQDEVVKWFTHSKKPLDLKTLGNIEQKIAQKFNAESFSDLGVGPFLLFIDQKSLYPLLGSSIITNTAEENDLDQLMSMKDDIVSFIKQCGDDKNEYDVIIQAIKKQFKWTRNWKNDKILSIIKENRPSDDSPGTCNVTFIHTLNCSRENQPASSSDESTGALGYFTKEEAVKCLKAAPLLENLATWSCWDVVFEPEFGDLKSFIADCDDLHAIETATNNLLRISLDSTVDDLGKAIIAEEPQDAAGHLLSIILSNGGLDRSPIIHIANVMKTSLTMLMAPERGSSSLAIEKFVLDCMMHIPIHFCSSIFTKLFLSPLHEILGDDYGRDPIPARILRVCSTLAEKSYLHSLGAVLAIKEWEEDFRQNCFALKEEKKRREIVKEERMVKKKDNQIEISEKIKVETYNNGKNSSSSEEKSSKSPGNEEKDPKSNAMSKGGSHFEGEAEHELKSADAVCSESEFEIQEEEELKIPDAFSEIEERLNHCKNIVETIRRNEFGIGEEIGEKEKVLLEKNNARLCRSLDRLSTELYAKDSHFVLELVQNADDNTYDDELMQADSEEKPSVAFIVDKDRVTVLNNEHGFEDINIKAICDIGKSTKGKHRKGYIGQKGIGFKSVFRITDCPEIHSNGFNIRFDASQDKMGYILPTWQDEFNDYSDYSPVDCNLQLNWKTQIDLPFKKELAKSDSTRSRFQDIHPTLLMFLNRLGVLIIENKIDGKCIVMKKRKKGEHFLELTQNGIPSIWFVFTKEIAMHARGEDETTDVSLAFPLDDIINSDLKLQALPPQNVHAFLPLRSYGFKFLIQADFEVPSSREDIDRDSLWNQEVLKEIPRLVIDAFKAFLTNSLDETMPRALQRAIKFFQFLPLESEIQGVFKPVARKILHGLQNIECIPVQRERPSGIDEDIFDVDWVKPSQVLLGDPLLCKTILPSELKEYLDLSYISNVMTKNVNPALLKCLGIKAESLDILVELCRSHLKKIAAEKVKEGETVQWIGNWLLCVAQYMEREYDSSNASLQQIRSSVVFPLSNGKIVNLLNQTVFFPFEKHTKKSKSKHGDYISRIEEDLCTIDARIYAGIDEIDKLKLERFLASLGVKKMSPKEVIQKHIMPVFTSERWSEKKSLLVSYLMYMKEQYFKDKDNVDIEALKQNVIICTNHGYLKPTAEQMYFSLAYGRGTFDLKATFPCVNWCLLDEAYLESSPGDDTTWQKFFRLLGVLDFPIMKRVKVSVHGTEMATPSLNKLKRNLPIAADHIIDLACPEFEQVLDSKDPKQLLALAEQLNNRWKSHFHHITSVPVKDRQDKTVAVTVSSFLIKLRTNAWLPTSDGETLFKPEDLYLQLPEIINVLGDHCNYFYGTLNEQEFIKEIKIRDLVKVETVFEKLREWSSNDDFATTPAHMMGLYNFLKHHIKEIDPAEFNMPFIFVPTSFGPRKVFYRGKFHHRGEVCVNDNSGVMAKRGNLLRNKRILLFKHYPKDILDFFEKDLNIDATPTLRDYIDMACALADETRLPDNEAYKDLIELFIVIGERCTSNDLQEEFRDSVKETGDIWEGYENLKKNLENNQNAKFVYENLRGEKIFPTTRNTFVSFAERPLLADDQDEQKIYENEKEVHFIIQPEMKSTLRRRPAMTPEDKSARKRENRREFQNLAFFAICRVDTLSSVISAADVTPENVIIGCEKWHNTFSSLLPYAQRYVFTNNEGIYESLVGEGLAEKLKSLTFSVANRITTVHRLKGREDVNVKRKANCCVEKTEERIYFHIARDSLNETDDLLAEFVKIFTKDSKKLADDLVNFLYLIYHELQSDKKIASICKKKKILDLPDEELWKLEAISKPPPSRQISRVAEEIQPARTGELTCWPPRAPKEYSSSFAAANRPHEDSTRQPTWAEPAPPESVKPVDVIPVIKNGPVEVPNLPSTTVAQSPSKEMPVKLAKIGPRKDAEASVIDSHAPPITEKHEVVKTEENNMDDKNSKIVASTSVHGDSPVELKQEGKGAEVLLVNKEMKSVNRNGNPNVITSVSPALNSESAAVQRIPLEKLQISSFKIPFENISKKANAMIVTMNNENTRETGRIGEAIVFEMLLKKYLELISYRLVEVKWVNKDWESELPYDIIITDTRPTERKTWYIEVKTTTALEDHGFIMSSHELRSAFQCGDHYHVYRVCVVRSSAEVQVKEMKGFSRYLDAQVANIFIAF